VSRIALSLLLLVAASTIAPTFAQSACNSGVVYLDRNGNGMQDRGERGLPGIRVSDGERIVSTDAHGSYSLPVELNRTVFVIKPAGYAFESRSNGLPDYWRNLPVDSAPLLKYGGMRNTSVACHDFALRPRKSARDDLDVLVFGDPQPKSLADVGYYERDIVAPIIARQRASHRSAALGISLGDIVSDDLSLYPAINSVTASLGTPWLHVPGNHDVDADAPSDAEALSTFRSTFGPDTFAWEESNAEFIVMDDVVSMPGEKPVYIGGLREDQFAFLQSYLPTVPKDRLLVIGVHIPFFNAAPPGMPETFRSKDREHLFALLKDFPHVLLLSAHTHNQRQFFHDGSDGWNGAQPLYEYNVGTTCGAFWSGLKDADGIPDSGMSDGTPNGYATLKVKPDGAFAVAWHVARMPDDDQIALHAPKVLRHGAYAAYGVFANVFMGGDRSMVEYRIDGGAWKPMTRVLAADPSLVAENMRDDEADALRGYDRSPEAAPSTHMWRGLLATDLPVGEHRIEVRANTPGMAEAHATTSYRLQDAEE
jgi:hypothetical protein